MTLRLTNREQAAVAQMMQTLLTPLAHPDTASWCVAVTRGLKECLRADLATFFLPTPQEFVIQCEEIDVGALRPYPNMVSPVASRISLWERLVRWGTYGRRELWQPHLDEYYRSEYYNDYLVPLRCFDAIGLAMLAPGAESEVPAFRNIAQVIVHHDDPGTPSFGARGVAMLRLLEPSFRAGVLALSWQAQSRASFARLVDELGQALLIVDLAGRVLHRTPALETLLAVDTERHLLEAALGEVTIGALAVFRPPRPGEPSPMVSHSDVTRVVRSAMGSYRVSTSMLPPDALRPEPLLAVALERLAPGALSDAELVSRYRLTAREIQVARLIATGRSSADTARALGISLHTVRRHSERIFAKLGVTTRAALGHRLAGG